MEETVRKRLKTDENTIIMFGRRKRFKHDDMNQKKAFLVWSNDLGLIFRGRGKGV